MTDREKLGIFIDYKTRLGPDNWQPRLWAREVVAPSSIWQKVANEHAMSRLDIVSRVLSGYTGIPTGEPELELCLLNIMSPIMSLLIIGKKLQMEHLPILADDPDMISRSAKSFIFAGIDKLAEEYAARRGSMKHTKKKK